jgi:hypothetical protein
MNSPDGEQTAECNPVSGLIVGLPIVIVPFSGTEDATRDEQVMA